MAINEKKIDNLLLLNPSERFEYLIRYIADFESMTIISTPSNELVTNKLSGDEVFFIWPEFEVAERCGKFGDKVDTLVFSKISLSTFLEDISDYLIENKISIGAFFDRHKKGYILDAKVFVETLKAELKQYE